VRAQGEKHNGFNVLLLHATKLRQLSLKELCDFFKDALLVEEEHQRHLAKLAARLALLGAGSSVGALWDVVRGGLGALLRLHQELAARLADVQREALRYADDQARQQKQVKEAEARTGDAVNLVQTTTTCLQKARETYAARLHELERLRHAEPPAPRDLARQELKARKACACPRVPSHPTPTPALHRRRRVQALRGQARARAGAVRGAHGGVVPGAGGVAGQWAPQQTIRCRRTCRRPRRRTWAACGSCWRSTRRCSSPASCRCTR